MARAVFGGGLSPYITKAQDRPTPYNPLGALSTAIRQPFVTDVIVPGISRIRDEMRISEQEEQIAAQAEAKRAAAAQFLQQAAAAEQQGLDAEVAAAVSGVDVPMVSEGKPQFGELSNLATGLRRITTPVGMHSDMQSRYEKGRSLGLDTRAGLVSALGGTLKNSDLVGEPSLRAAMMLERELAAIKRGPSASGARKEGGSLDKAKRIAKGLRDRGLGDIVAEIVQGATAEEAFMAAGQQLQQTQQRRGEQEATAAATQRFERALAGELPQVAAEQGAQPIVRDGEVVLPPNWEDLPMNHPQRAAYRQFKKTGELPAPPAQAAQPQAIQSPESIERANRLRQQATDMEREATGIEGTPVYRTFGDHAMAFLDALDSGDVATQMALMESVGGSTDYQPFGKGAVGKAIGKDASMRARRDLLDLKKKYLDAKRREDSAMKLVEKKAELRGKKTRTGGRGGGGTTRTKDRVLDSALQTLHRGEELSVNQQKALKKGGLLTEREVAALSPDRPDAWAVLRSRMSKRTPLRNDAATILKSRATFEEREVRKVAADEKAEQNAIKKLEAEVRVATGDEKKRKKEELGRVKRRQAVRSEVRTAQAKLAAASEKVRRFTRAVENAEREQDLNIKKHDAITGTDAESLKAKSAYADAANAATDRVIQANTELTAQAATEERLKGYLNEAEAKWDALPAKANP